MKDWSEEEKGTWTRDSGKKKAMSEKRDQVEEGEDIGSEESD